MKLVYLAQVGLYDDWAQTVQVVNMCESFAECGVSVTLCVPKRTSSKSADPFSYLGVRPVFRIVQIPYLDIFQGSPSRVLYWVRMVSFFISARLYVLFKTYDVLYTRELYAGLLFRNFFLERHSFPAQVNAVHRHIFRAARGIIVLTSFIKSKMIAVGVSPDKIMVAPDAVRLEDFASVPSVGEARRKLGLPENVRIMGYIGTLKTMGMEKGVATAIESLAYLPEGHMLYVVGGEKEDVSYYEQYAKTQGVRDKVVFAGKVPHSRISLYAAACNVLVAPFPDTEHYRHYMSPLKIFEYMAAGRPIVVTDLPSLREILTNEKTALFVPPEDSRALAETVRRIAGDDNLAGSLSQSARAEAERHTWLSRAENILDFIRLS